MKTLEPCPFCGSDVDFFMHLADDSGYTELIIDCKECPAGMEIWVDSDKEKDVEDAKKELFTAWNTRIEPIAKVQVNVHPCGISGICLSCGGDVYNVDPYCSHCGAKLEWNGM